MQHAFPVPRLMWSEPAIAATASEVIDMPQAPAYAWILEALTDSGTSPTLDVALQITADESTYWSVSRWAQVTTTDVRSMKVHSNGPIVGQAAAVTAIADTGGALESNFVATRKMAIKATVGGTNPAFATFKVWLIPISNLMVACY